MPRVFITNQSLYQKGAVTLALLTAIAASPALVGCTSAVKKSDSSGYSGHGAASVAPEVLAKFAPPSLDPSVARRIQMMLDVKAPGMGVLTPDAKRLFFGWSVSGTPQVWRIDGPKSFPVQTTGGNDVTAIAGLTPDGKWLIVSRDRNGEENPGIYLQSVSGGALKSVFHKPGVRASVRWVSDDSRWLYYTANDVKPDSYAIYRYDIETGERDAIFTEPGLWSIADVRKDGLLLLVKFTGSRSSEFSTFEPTTKKLTPIVGQGESEEYDARFAPRAGEFLVQTNKFGDFRRLYKLKDGQFKPLTPERTMDVEDFDIDHPRRKVIVSWNDHGYSRIEAYDADTFKPLRLPKFEAEHVYAGSMTRDGRYMTIGVETSKAPRTSYVYDWSNGKLTQWVLPSSPEIDTKLFSEAKLETYPARDGTKIPMLVRRPGKCATRPCPVVVSFHGGPESQSRPGFNQYAQLYVDAGFVFIEPNVRGSDGFGKTWLNSDNGSKRLNVVTDIEDAAVYVRKAFAENGVEPKVGITGGSYGGYSTLMGMTRFAGAYDAGVANVGMSNLVTFLMNTAPYRRILRTTEYGDPEKDREALVQLSPITYLDKIRAPLLIIQGVSDPRVPAGEAIQMYEAMKKKGLDAQLILFADEGHGTQKRENKVLEVGHAIAFFQKHLLGQGQK